MAPRGGSVRTLVLELCFDEFAVQAGDVGERDALRTFGGAGTGVGAVAESEFVHLFHHGACTACAFDLALGKECELAYLGRYEQHCRTILTCSYAGTATDTCSGVHGEVGVDLGDGKVVGILCASAVERYVTAGLLNLVERVAVNHKVLDYGERGRAPRLYCDSLAVFETTHVQLAGGGSGGRTVGMSVDVQRAHTADTFTAVVVEYYGLFVVVDELFVKYVESFKERGVGISVNRISLELAFFLWSGLTPNFEIYRYF